MKSVCRYIFLSSFLVFTWKSAFSNSCDRSVNETLNAVHIEKAARDSVTSRRKDPFHAETFDSALQKFEQRLERGEVIRPEEVKNPSAKLAFLHAAAKAGGQDLMGIENMVHSRGLYQRLLVKRLLKPLNFEKGVTREDVLDFMEQLYVIANGTPGTVLFLLQNLRHPVSANFRGRIRQHIVHEISDRNAVSALEKLGFIRNRNTLEHLKKAVQTSAKSFLTLAWLTGNSYLLIKYGFLLFIPEFKTINLKPLSDRAKKRVMEVGFEEAYKDNAKDVEDNLPPGLKKAYMKFAATDMMISMASKTYNYFTLALIIYLIIDNWDAITWYLKAGRVGIKDLKRYEKKNCTEHSIRDEQFDSWKRGFKTLHGRDPNQEEQARQRKYLNRMNEKELKLFK